GEDHGLLAGAGHAFDVELLGDVEQLVRRHPLQVAQRVLREALGDARRRQAVRLLVAVAVVLGQAAVAVAVALAVAAVAEAVATAAAGAAVVAVALVLLALRLAAFALGVAAAGGGRGGRRLGGRRGRGLGGGRGWLGVGGRRCRRRGRGLRRARRGRGGRRLRRLRGIGGGGKERNGKRCRRGAARWSTPDAPNLTPGAGHGKRPRGAVQGPRRVRSAPPDGLPAYRAFSITCASWDLPTAPIWVAWTWPSLNSSSIGIERTW